MANKARTNPPRPLDPDTMGRMGEARFGEMCDGAGLIANDSRRADRMGWDYHVEFPLPHKRTDAPFDSRLKLPDMKVQVKTIWADNSNVDLELPAAERLVRWDYPSFIVILRMSMDRSFHDACVIHLIGDNLARVLKALRRAEAKGSLSIKSKTISFGFQHGVKIHADGNDLSKVLRDAIGEQPETYGARKNDRLRNLGFEAARYEGSFALQAESEDEVLDVFLGLKKGEATKFHADEVRFGIPIANLREEHVQLEFKPKVLGACDFTIVSTKGERKRANFQADLQIASTRHDPKGPWKIRLHSPLLDLTASNIDKQASLRFGPVDGQRLSIEDIIQINRAYLALASGPCLATVKLSGKQLLSLDLSSTLPFSKETYASRVKFLSDFDRLLRSVAVPRLHVRG